MTAYIYTLRHRPGSAPEPEPTPPSTTGSALISRFQIQLKKTHNRIVPELSGVRTLVYTHLTTRMVYAYVPEEDAGYYATNDDDDFIS